MIPLDIIKKFYKEESEQYQILVQHSMSVAQKTLDIAEMRSDLQLDKTFLYEAAMLHDIGIFKTEAPEIHCFGDHPYICHGYLGADLIRNEGYPQHALVCERHTGTGLTEERIKEKNYPVPLRDMRPVSLEEQLICFADKFYSKTKLDKEKPIDKIRKSLSKYGDVSVDRFDNWCKFFLG